MRKTNDCEALISHTLNPCPSKATGRNQYEPDLEANDHSMLTMEMTILIETASSRSRRQVRNQPNPGLPRRSPTGYR